MYSYRWTKRFGVVLMFGQGNLYVFRFTSAIDSDNRAGHHALQRYALACLSGFYDATITDRHYEAVIPSIWTSIALNMSIITACLPSIKHFLADWAAGVLNAAISEPVEQQLSTGRSKNGYGQWSVIGTTKLWQISAGHQERLSSRA